MPGQSGNPKGRAGERIYKGKTLPELARALTGEALEVIGRVLRDPKAPQALQMQAAALVLQRGWGDAPKAPTNALEGVTIVVQHLGHPTTPANGVISSPLLEAVPQPAPIASELLDADGSIITAETP